MSNAKKKRLKLMPDYECYPLWLESESAPENISPASLPIEPELSESLTRWALTYDQTLNLDDPASSGFSSPEKAEDFDEKGKVMWVSLRNQLPDYEVTYFSIILIEELLPE